MTPPKCPRCGGNQSRNPVPSRTDGTPVCAACGTEERFEVLRHELTKKAAWPVQRRTTA